MSENTGPVAELVEHLRGVDLARAVARDQVGDQDVEEVGLQQPIDLFALNLLRWEILSIIRSRSSAV